MVKPSGKRPRTGPPVRDGDTEQRILDAAHAVFLRRGTAGARTQEIAVEAGVNSALLHYYFRSKERLADAVFRRAAGELFPVVAGVLGSDLPLEEKVRKVIEIVLETLTGVRPDALGRTLRTTIHAQIRAEVRAGRIRPIAAEQFLVNLLSMCIFPFAAQPMFGALLGLEGERFTRFIRERRRELPEFFMKALRP